MSGAARSGDGGGSIGQDGSALDYPFDAEGGEGATQFSGGRGGAGPDTGDGTEGQGGHCSVEGVGCGAGGGGLFGGGGGYGGVGGGGSSAYSFFGWGNAQYDGREGGDGEVVIRW